MISVLVTFISIAAVTPEPARLVDATSAYAGALTVARAGDLDAAETIARSALKTDPLHIPCRRLLDLIGDRRDSRVNEETFAAVLSGMALQDAGDGKAARQAYEQALEFQPDYYFALHNLGTLMYADGDNDEAIALYERALASNADYPYTENNLGLALARADRAEAALPHYRTALRLYPDYHKAYNNLGASLAKLGKTDEARAMYVKALKLKPDYVLAQAGVFYGPASATAAGDGPSPEEPPPAAALLAVVETGNPAARTRAVEALVKSHADTAGSAALPLLRHERAVVRVAAVSLLKKAPFAGAVDMLVDLLKRDPDWAVRVQAAEALGTVEDSRAPETLMKALRTDKEPNVRVAAAHSLAHYPSCASAKALRRAQRDRILEVARAAGESVAYLGGGTALGDPREPDPWVVDVCAADVLAQP